MIDYTKFADRSDLMYQEFPKCSPPYILKKFDTFEEARSFQINKIKELLDQGFSFRAVELNGEQDYDTKKYTWQVFIRVIEIIYTDTDEDRKKYLGIPIPEKKITGFGLLKVKDKK